jgi:autotransporter-associated beta strand protein
MHKHPPFARAAMVMALLACLGLVACGGSSSSNDSSNTSTSSTTQSTPTAPTGLGYSDSADAPSGVTAFVDAGSTNVRGDACHATLDTNAGVRVLKGFLDFWSPLAVNGTVYVDAGSSAAASGTCAAVATSLWSGIPGTSPDGTVANSSVHNTNITYVQTTTANRTSSQALAAFLDDRRDKGYSVTDGLGSLTSIWRTGAGQSFSFTIGSDTATTYSDTSKIDATSTTTYTVTSSIGSTSSNLGLAVAFMNNVDSASTEPTKRYFKYGRPFRWNTNFGYTVGVVPALVQFESTTPVTDGGFPSGHTAEAWRDALLMAYLVPQRYQELITRAMELGQNRIVSGMHSPLDVMGGRILGTANIAYDLNGNTANGYYTSAVKQAAYNQAQSYLMTKTGSSDFNTLNSYAHTQQTTDTSADNYDRFTDHATNKTNFATRLTYGFGLVNASKAGQSATVPKGAEVLLETRQPYLTAAQRRVVLKTTEIDSGYPLADDDEGWGRLNLFAAADGYGAFNGDVSVTMDATQGGFYALDSWRNDISGAGLLTKLGTGTLRLTGANTYTGGTILSAGTLAADSGSALGTGDVYIKAGTLISDASSQLNIGGKFTQLGGTLEVDMNSATQGTLKIAGTATLSGGTLYITFPGSYSPAAGDSITVLTAGALTGTFSTITVKGFSSATPTYTSTGLSLKLGSKSST